MKAVLKVMMEDCVGFAIPLVLCLLIIVAALAPIFLAIYLNHLAPLLIYAAMAFAAWVVNARKRAGSEHQGSA